MSSLVTSMLTASIAETSPTIEARRIVLSVLGMDGLSLGEQLTLAVELGMAAGRRRERAMRAELERRHAV